MARLPRPPTASPCCSDEKGEALGSIEFAKKLEAWRDGGKREARFLIGGADGFGADERAGADLLLAFGRATWPHLLARAMLAEQLFPRDEPACEPPLSSGRIGHDPGSSFHLSCRRRGAAAAQTAPDAATLAAAKAERADANARYQALDREAQRATSDADRARAAAAALAARIEAAEADLTAAERRIAIIAELQTAQRARLAERQGPLIRLTAALQTMTRRPAALALIQPGSVRDAVHVRSLLAATMPEIRHRTAALRAEVVRSRRLAPRMPNSPRQGLIDSRTALHQRRLALARFEAGERARSQQLAGLALSQSDRALVFGEEARSLERTIGTRDYQTALAARLARLPGPLPRPDLPRRAGRRRPDLALYAAGRGAVDYRRRRDFGRRRPIRAASPSRPPPTRGWWRGRRPRRLCGSVPPLRQCRESSTMAPAGRASSPTSPRSRSPPVPPSAVARRWAGPGTARPISPLNCAGTAARSRSPN